MSDSKKNGYDVGYGRPPKDTQFQKGSSGNPKGRPKKRRDIVSTLERTLAEPFTYREGEHVREMSAEEGILFTQIIKAMQGDQAAFNGVMKQAKRCGLILPRRRPGDRKPAGILIVPDPMTMDEWLGVADEPEEHQQ
jgi:hypothetical protein